ncbi:MAG TPA: hypothetical protein VH092_32115 [Urbifossiella sp.]|nr:hypothetical protein [Urbifossiella sp.]
MYPSRPTHAADSVFELPPVPKGSGRAAASGSPGDQLPPATADCVSPYARYASRAVTDPVSSSRASDDPRASNS